LNLNKNHSFGQEHIIETNPIKTDDDYIIKDKRQPKKHNLNLKSVIEVHKIESDNKHIQRPSRVAKYKHVNKITLNGHNGQSLPNKKIEFPKTTEIDIKYNETNNCTKGPVTKNRIQELTKKIKDMNTKFNNNKATQGPTEIAESTTSSNNFKFKTFNLHTETRQKERKK